MKQPKLEMEAALRVFKVSSTEWNEKEHIITPTVVTLPLSKVIITLTYPQYTVSLK